MRSLQLQIQFVVIGLCLMHVHSFQLFISAPSTVESKFLIRGFCPRQQRAHASALRVSASTPDSTWTAPSVLFLSYVGGMDVEKCTRLLSTNGARNVEVGDAKYGSKIVASIDVEPLLSLAPEIAQLVKPSGRLEIGPLTTSKTELIVKAFSPFFEDIKEIQDEGSMRITGWRKDPWMVPGFSSVELAQEREATQTDSVFWKWNKEAWRLKMEGKK